MSAVRLTQRVDGSFVRPDLTPRDGMPLQHLMWWLEDRLEVMRTERHARRVAAAQAAYPDMRVG